jgi:hypothetical protein
VVPNSFDVGVVTSQNAQGCGKGFFRLGFAVQGNLNFTKNFELLKILRGFRIDAGFEEVGGEFQEPHPA